MSQADEYPLINIITENRIKRNVAVLCENKGTLT